MKIGLVALAAGRGEAKARQGLMSEIQHDPALPTGFHRQQQLHRYALACDQIAGLQVLQIGLGDAVGAALLSGRAANLTGVDSDPARVAAATGRRITQTRFQVASPQALPFEADAFDAVIAFDLDWPDTIEVVLTEIRRVLKPGGFAMLRAPGRLSGTIETEIRRVFRRRFALGQRMVVASSIGPASAAALPNAADYRGYTLAAGGETVAGVARLSDPEDVIWIVGETALPRAESADSLFLDPGDDLLGKVIDARPGGEPASQAPIGEMAVLTALIEQLADGPVAGDAASLARALGQANVRLAVQDLKLADKERLNAGLVAAEQEYRRLADQLRESREDTAATRLLATEQRALAAQLGERLEAATREAEARRQIIDETLEQAQTLAVDLERARQEAARTSELAARLDEELARARQETEAAQSASNQLAQTLQDLQIRLDEKDGDVEAAQSLAQTLDGDAARAREDIESQRAAAEFASRQVEMLTGEVAGLRDLLLASETEALQRTDTIRRLEEEGEAVRSAFGRFELEREEAVAATSRAELEIQTLRSDLAETQAVGEALRQELDLERDAAIRANADAAGLQTQLLEIEAVREAAESEARRLQGELEVLQSSRSLAPAKAAPATRQGAELSFALGLRERIQHSAVAEVQAYRSGLAAATTVQAIKKDLAQQLSRADGVAALLPPTAPALATGPRRAISRKTRLRALLKGDTRHETPPAPLEAVAILFDAAYYVEQNGVKPAQGETPFDHYIRIGRRKGLSTHPLIDADWIRNTWPDAAETPFDLFSYLTDVRQHDRSPHPLFEADHYRRMNRDVGDAGVNPLAHYLLHGWREGREPNQVFDSEWYLATHQDVLAAGLNPLLHYARHGASELRQPHPLFDHGFYLDRYPDVAASGMDAYAHFIAYGRAEGRPPSRQVLDMQRLERFFDGATINDLLLLEPTPERRLRPVEDGFWPPRPAEGYWLPQKLRDFIIDRYGEDQLQLNAWLFSLVERFAKNPGTFDQSPECRKLIERARLLASTPLNGRPRASIIIPVYNNLLYTLTCLVSVLESAPNHSFEILIGDDGSTDGTAAAMAEIGGLVRHVRHPRNLGFLGNCNAVARRATGEHLILLNNDTIVFPDWLNVLVETLDGDPSIGFVGSKLLNGDGSLQEAGGIFWKDGSAWNFGRDGDPLAPEFNYLKDIDYVSGASIAVPMRLWKALDGFDPAYSPAYCEDSDLAFRIREAGYRTVYHPHSVLVHHEGRSHGRDVASGVKAYQVINQKKFLERWGPILAEQNFDNAQNVFLARDRSRDRPHILIVDHYVPQWDQDAGSRTMFHFIRAFVNRGFQVTLWPDNLNEDRDYSAPLQAMGVEVIYGPRFVGGFPAWLAENHAYLDYALLSRPHISENYIDAVRAADVKTFYYGHDLHCMRARSTYQVTGDRNDLIEAEAWEVRELSVSLKSDVVMYPGIEEIDYMSRLLPSSAKLIRPPITIFDAQELDAADQAIADADQVDPYALMFVGGFSHTPNGDGITWFLDQIWPRLRAADDRFTLRIAGSKMPDSLRERGDPGVEYLGRVSDEELAAIYANAGAAIVPLRYGGGIKGKVIEAFARGVPVVMTDIGAQGIPDAADIGFVAGADAGFADAVLAAVTQRDDALARARRAVDFLRVAYSEQTFCNRLAAEAPELSGPAS